MNWFKTSDLKKGYKGKTADIRTRAAADVAAGYEAKTDLLEGCVKAFEEGRHENLRAFLGAYLEFKRKVGAIEKLPTEPMDNGFINLVARPLLQLIEKSKSPAETIEALTCDMSPFYKQVALDLTLRHACSKTGSWFVAEAVLTAGADVNTGGGRPLASALRHDNLRIAKILYTHGANFDATPAFAEEDGHAAKAAALKEKFNSTVALKNAPPAPTEPPAEKDQPPVRKELIL